MSKIINVDIEFNYHTIVVASIDSVSLRATNFDDATHQPNHWTLIVQVKQLTFNLPYNDLESALQEYNRFIEVLSNG